MESNFDHAAASYRVQTGEALPCALTPQGWGL